MVNCNLLVSCAKSIYDWTYGIFIVTRKNLRMRRRRIIPFIYEMFIPIVIATILAGANTNKSLLRTKTSSAAHAHDEDDTVEILEKYYDLGNSINNDLIINYTLCIQKIDPLNCRIGYVADPDTENAVFNPAKLNATFKDTKFTKFDDEEEIDKCLNDGIDCAKLKENIIPGTDADQEDPVLGFRAAVIFQTSVNDAEVKYKIRLMETHYGSLRHVMKTHRLFLSLYDRRESIEITRGKSYLQTGFLSLQLYIDKMIIEHIKAQLLQVDNNSIAHQIDFKKGSDCTCEIKIHESPHRQSDQYHDDEDALEKDPNFKDLYEIWDDDVFVQSDLEDINRADRVNKQSLIVSTVLVLSFIFLIPSEQRRIASEKENGLTILLLVTGMTHRMQWLGNLLSTTLSYIFPVTIVTILLTVRFNEREGAVFEYVSGTLLWVLLFLYVMALASICYFTTVFFDRPMTAITASVSFWTTSFLAPLYHIDYYYDLVPVWVVLLTCGFHPCITLGLGLRLLIRFEKYHVHSDTFSVAESIPTDSLKIVFIICVLTVDILVYTMLAIYLDRILKSKYGITKPWYYICKPSEYQSSTGKVAPEAMIQKFADQPGHEPCHENIQPSIITSNLTKKYGKVVALENVNVQFNHGEIFALLGHNGSGKSTLLNVFSGYTPVTSGTAVICGYDIKTHMVQIQEFTGVCPQTSALYDDLTPLEHLMIFGRLRGLRSEAAAEESNELMEKLRFHEMANWVTRKLSKGEKRKLSLAIALIGNPKIILLDEPTGGLDYYSRRAVWDILLKIRSKHTIIFSTHFMDEAELLGDRIGILAGGKMQVCGSYAFLRRHFGLAYSLKVRMDPQQSSDPQKILQVVRGVMPNSTLSTLHISPNSNRLCTCNLPMQDYSSAAMSELFTDLARLKKSLGIVGFAVSASTVEEIFLILTRQLKPAADEVVPIEIEEENYNMDNHDELLQKLFRVEPPILLPLMHFHLLLQKRMLYAWRHKKILIFQIIVPVSIFLIAIFRLSSHIDLNGRIGAPLEITLNSYTNPITLYHASRRTFISREVLEAVIGPSAVFSKNSDISGEYIRLEYNVLRRNHIIGTSVETGDHGQIYAHFNPYAIHASPLALSVFSNTLVKYMDISRRITTTNHPLQHPYYSGYTIEEDPYALDLFAILITLSANINVGFCIIFPLEERLSQTKHLQLMAGVRPCIYWLAIFCWDALVIFLECVIVIVLCFFYKPIRILILNCDVWGTGIGILFGTWAFMYSGLMVSYVISRFAGTKSAGFAMYTSATLLFGVILPFSMLGVGLSDEDIDPNTMHLLSLIPCFAFTSALRKFAATLFSNGRCNHFSEKGIEQYCRLPEEGAEFTKVSVACCPNCMEHVGATSCYDTKEFIRSPWSNLQRHYNETTSSNLQESHKSANRSIFKEIVFLCLTGIFLNLLIVFLDSDYWNYLYSCVCGERARTFQTDVDDEDVLVEADKVSSMVNKNKTDKEALLVHNLCKSYGTYPALHNLSFEVRPGECFGLIGVTGAGKSTLFRLLTGASAQSFGNVYSVKCNLSSNRSHLMEKIGYAPEHAGSLFSYMTCAENIILFGRLRGLSKREANVASDDLLKMMDLDRLPKEAISKFNDGTRRILTSLVAVVAEPPILILDELTSAADPSAQRAYWELIKRMKKAGHTIILNSHRINECEEMCNRIAILIDGKFQCIGSPNHLKEKFGSGYKLLVKLMPSTAESQGYVSSLSDTIVKTFNPCTLRDRRRNVIQYVIHDADFSWDYLFLMMEHIKLRYNDLVEDYSFSNTTLDEVYLSFVLLQNCGRLINQLA